MAACGAGRTASRGPKPGSSPTLPHGRSPGTRERSLPQELWWTKRRGAWVGCYRLFTTVGPTYERMLGLWKQQGQEVRRICPSPAGPAAPTPQLSLDQIHGAPQRQGQIWRGVGAWGKGSEGGVGGDCSVRAGPAGQWAGRANRGSPVRIEAYPAH